jgi:TonB-linked SusC/RagA family outer membrane protein
MQAEASVACESNNIFLPVFIMFTKNKLISVFILAAALWPFGAIIAADIDSPDKQEVLQDGILRGTVKDADGPLAGASVHVEGTTIGTATDNEGRFTLRNIKRGAKIKVSFLGYKSEEIVYTGQESLDFTIVEDSNVLEEAVVTALGIKKEARALGFAATTISSKELTKVGTPNFGTALYGKAPGVRINTMQGGSIAGVSITVRGINSITGSNQPLVVMNGVPIRNGGTGSGNEATFAEFGAEGRIRSNGLIDINPEDIESLTILKGAAATALYGSEAANGVIMIESKKAKSGTMTVDFNATLTMNEVYMVPAQQSEYGPGTYTSSWSAYEIANNGFYSRTLDGVEYKSLRYGNAAWGPKYDGTEVLYWDGKTRPYWPSSTDPWSVFFRTGYNQNYNFAVNHGSDKARTRFAYTFNQETPNVPTADYKKHNFQMNGSLNISKALTFDYAANYVMQNIHNRAGNNMGLYWSYSHGFTTFMDVPLMKRMYKTSLGYRNVNRGEDTLTPDEAFAFSASERTGIGNVFWDTYEDQMDEQSNRLIAHVTPKLKITDWLTAKTQLSTDMTTELQERRNRTTQPLALGKDPSGEYSAYSRRYDIRYGDFMITANKRLTDKLNLVVNAGWQGRYERMLNLMSKTNGGLTTENWFHLNASRYQATTSIGSLEALKTAWLGMIDLEWENYLYLTITGRQDKTSTLHSGANTFFYPSVSGSFIYTDAFKGSLPDWYQYGKFRASYGMNGNYPGIYSANVVYEQGSNNDYTYNHVRTAFGNDQIKPEITREIELGLENKMFNNRFGFEITYYTRKITDQILPTPQPVSSGVATILLNVGTLKNYGAELNIYGTPIQTRNFSWTPTLNIARNFNEIVYLTEGVEFIENASFGSGGAPLRSYVGRPMGDFYVQVPLEDENGNKLTDAGYYVTASDFACVGNAQPKFVGGIMNQFVYRDFFCDLMADFVIGGQVINEMWHYTTALGLTPQTLKGREDGVAYYYPGSATSSRGNSGITPVAAEPGAVSGPDGEVIYHDGVIQEGIDINTGLPNTQVRPLSQLTYATYGWSTGTRSKTYAHSIFDKTYMKVRELAIGYNIPKKFASKLYCKNLSVSLFARNLFYIYKAMPDWDVESSIGTSWVNQASAGGSTAPNRSYGLTVRASF